MDILDYHIPSLVGAGAAFTSVYADRDNQAVNDWLPFHVIVCVVQT